MRATNAPPLPLAMLALNAATLWACNAETTAPVEEAPPPSQLSALSVEVMLDDPPTVTLVPAIAFVQATTYELVQPTFDGEVPGDFRLDLDPLSARVVSQRIQLDDEPSAVIGLFAAISSERAAERATQRWVSWGNYCEDYSDASTCVARATWCPTNTVDPVCYAEDYACSDDAFYQTMDDTLIHSESWQHDRDLLNVNVGAQLLLAEGCTLIGTEGDAALREPVESYFELADNYWLLHLTAHAPAGSVTSYLMGETDAIPAGYSVIALDRFEESAAQADAREACEQDARDEAAEQVESAHRVTLSAADFDLETCTQGISICDEAMTLALRARANLNCPFAGYAPRRVAETDLPTLDMTFGNDPVFPW
jgi:hypothetical protein